MDASRIKLPDKLKNYGINPKWRRRGPIFVAGGVTGFTNIINGEVPAQNHTTYTEEIFGSAGRGHYNPTASSASRSGFNYERTTYEQTGGFTIFIVAQYTGTNLSGQPMIMNGSSQGVDEVNYRVRNKSATREITFDTIDSGSGYSANSGLFAKDGEPSTISFSVQGTHIEWCLDGSLGSTTSSVTPAVASKGNHSLFYETGGSNISTDSTLYLVSVFDQFIANDVMLDLHNNPRDLFIAPEPTQYIVSAPAASVGGGLTRSILLNRRKIVG